MAWPGQQIWVNFLSKANGGLDPQEQSTVNQKLLSAKVASYMCWLVQEGSLMQAIFTNLQNYECQLHGKRPEKIVHTCAHFSVLFACIDDHTIFNFYLLNLTSD